MSVPHIGNYVGYYRVSTDKQGQSKLGLEAQQAAVRTFLNGGSWKLIAEYTEVESGKTVKNRPQLRAAMAHAKKAKATLLVAKLDRLARNVHFISGLMESKVDFVACDFPEANRLTVHILAAVAEHEREMISLRTKAACAARRARGHRLGNPNLLADNAGRQQAARERAEALRATLEAYRSQGTSQRQIVEELNRLGVKTARGGDWSLVQLQRVLKRLSPAASSPA